MDLSAIIVTIILGGLFFGFIAWMAIHSRRAEAEQLSPNNPETGLSDN